MEEWKEFKVGDIFHIQNGYAFKSGEFVDNSEDTYEVLKIGHIEVGGGLRSDPKRTYVKRSDKFKKWVLEKNDIVMGMTDMKSNVVILGIPALVDKDDTYVLNQRVARLSLIDSNSFDIYFCYYQMLWNEFTSELRKTANSGVQVNLTTSGISNTILYVPKIEIQKEIGRVLRALDDKIECNRRINENLEQQAQALFKSWFVDFEPFKDQPFVESELGMIPQKWRVQEAQEVFSINIGKTPPRKESEWFTVSSEDNVWVSIADMGSCGTFISDSSEYLTDEAVKRFNIQMVEKDSILLSFKLTVGRVAIADTRLTTNEAIARFILPEKSYREFLYLYLKQYKYGNLGSTSSIATAVNSKTIKGMKLLIPNAEVIERFNENTRPLFEQIRTIQQESRRLAELRDALLPKLMSGELKVENVTF